MSERLDSAMGRLAAGDRSQFSIVFQELWPILSRTCVAWLNDVDDGEDAAQRSLLTLMSRAHEYRPGGSCLGWALTLAMWECRSTRRRRTRRNAVSLDLVREHAAPDPSPESRAQHRELAQIALDVFEQLSPDDRLAIEGALFEDTGSSGPVPAAVRKRKQRAFERLRGLWRRLYGE